VFAGGFWHRLADMRRTTARLAAAAAATPREDGIGDAR
jgi:hypothetical protein